MLKVDISSNNYIIDFVCTYNYIKELEESEDLYRIQMLQEFGLRQFHEEKINLITENLYEQYKNNVYIKELIKTDIININNIFNDELAHFRMLFRYDTFHLLHNLLSSLIDNTKISDKNYDKLLSINNK